jgi:hypothetical protein
MIPAPADVPLLKPDGTPVNLKDKAFPVHLFPEYGGHKGSAPVVANAPASAPAPASASGSF